MKSLNECLNEALNKGTVYEYEKAKDTDNPSKFKDKIKIVGDQKEPIYTSMVTRDKDQFCKDCLATAEEAYGSKVKSIEIYAYDEDEADFVKFASCNGSQKEWNPEYIGSNPEFHKVFK